MGDDKEKPSFWTTLPGILTGVAALVTAIGGLILGLHQIRSSGPEQSRVENVSQESRAAKVPKQESLTSQPQGAGSTPDSSQLSKAGAPSQPSDASLQAPVQKGSGNGIPPTAVQITKTDGNVLWSFEDKFIWGSVNFAFDSGQLIPWSKIKTIEVLNSDDDKKRVRATLTNGKIVEGTSHYNYDVYGKNDLGEIEVNNQEVKRITFPH